MKKVSISQESYNEFDVFEITPKFKPSLSQAETIIFLLKCVGSQKITPQNLMSKVASKSWKKLLSFSRFLLFHFGITHYPGLIL